VVASPCLRTYRFEAHGGQVCLHLRIADSGTGTLFVDAQDAVHLSETAAEMALFALEAVPPAEAVRTLKARFRGVRPHLLRRDYDQVAQVVRHLSTPRPGCSTCGLDLEQSPLFSTRPDAPYRADLALTYRCNNNCTHCYNEEQRRSKQSLSVADWRRVLERLHRAGVPHLVFTGGEPTLFEGLPELVAHASRQGQLVGMNTNGRRLADPAILSALVSAGLNHVQTTLEAADARTHNAMVRADAFDETDQGLRNALTAGLHALTNTTLTQANAASATAVVEYVHGLGVRTFAMNGMIHSGRGASHPDALRPEELAPILVNVRERARELGMRFLWYTPTRYCALSPLELDLGPKRCTAAEYAVCVEPDGGVLPCQSWYEPVGNLLRDEWEALWNSPLFRAFRDRTATPRAFGLPHDCVDFPDLTVCAGGCPLETVCAPRTACSPRPHCG